MGWVKCELRIELIILFNIVELSIYDFVMDYWIEIGKYDFRNIGCFLFCWLFRKY